jgi:predicted PurR-regulated permease PerM
MSQIETNAAEPEERPRIYLPKAVSVSIMGTFLILLVAALYYGRDFFLPLMLAFLLTLTFMPMVRFFHRRGIPPVVSALILIAAMGAAGAGIALIAADPVTRMVTAGPEVAQKLKQRFNFLQRPMAVLVEAGEQVQDLAQPGTDDGTQKVVIAQPGVLSWAADTLTGVGSTLGLTLVLALFLLSSGDLFLQKLIRIMPKLSEKKKSLKVVHDIEYEVSRYLITITLINIAVGIAVAGVMVVFGMPDPLLWGIAAALLNFIPYIGPITGIALSFAVALVTFPTVTVALFPPLGYLAVHLLEATVITPLTLGRRLELNSVAILIALAFCTWMWSIVGALIAVPLLVVVKVFSDHFPNLATFGSFLSAEAPPAEATTEAEAEARSNGPARLPSAG